MAIIAVGSINMDVVTFAPRHPAPGETIMGSDVQFIPGGKGSNQAIAASRLGKDICLVGMLGNDSFGKELYQFLQNERINLDHILFSETAPSGTALITVNEASENTIVVVPGSNAQLHSNIIEEVPVNDGDIVVAPFEIPQETIRAIFLKAKKLKDTITIVNPAPAAPFIDGLQELCDYLIVNETELAFFAGEEVDPTRIIEHARMIRSNPEQVIIITLGSKGVICVDGDHSFSVEGRAVQAVDTTGAGDCFVGALAVALQENKTLENAIKFANTAASISVQRVGASASLPHRSELEQLS